METKELIFNKGDIKYFKEYINNYTKFELLSKDLNTMLEEIRTAINMGMLEYNINDYQINIEFNKLNKIKRIDLILIMRDTVKLNEYYLVNLYSNLE